LRAFRVRRVALLWRLTERPYSKISMIDPPVIATRVLAVLAAVLLVGALTLASVLPPDLPLAAALAMLDPDLLRQAQGYANDYLPGWAWPYIATPFLGRPVWLLPVALVWLPPEQLLPSLFQ
jgi:hypothetical protein